MASKKTATKAPQSDAKKKLPAGYALARTRLDGFMALEPGNSCEGVLRGSFEVKDKFKRDGTKTVFRIEVTKGETLIGEGEVVGEGAVVGIDEKGYTSVLGELEAGTPVFVLYEGLQDPTRDASRDNPHVFVVGRGA